MNRNFLYSLTQKDTSLEMLSFLLKNKTEIRYAVRNGVNYLLNDCKYYF